VLVNGGSIELVGIATKGDPLNTCREEGRAREFVVAHLNADGLLRGETSIPQGEIDGCAETIERAELDAERRLVYSGSFTRWPGLIPSDTDPESSRVVARLRPDGEFDDSLDGDGVAVDPKLPRRVPALALAAARHPHGGDLYVEDVYPSKGARLIRTGRNGKLVRGFGARIAGVGPGADLSLEAPWELAVDPTRGIYGFGRFYAHEGSGDIVHILFRHRLRDGKPDDSFGLDGAVEPRPEGARWWAAYDFALQPDGKTLVAGVVERGKQAHVFAARYTTTGEPDPSFGTDGFAEFDVGRSSGDDRDWLAAVATSGEGIVLTAWIRGRGTTVRRLREDGRLDQSFGRNGWVTVPRL
jgi:uncharacterized delta-60 repeat protein